MKVNDKIIMVTGGGNGMGRELVLLLLEKHARVIAVDVNEAALHETSRLAGEYAHSLTTLTADITKKQTVESLLNDVLAVYGYIDGIINNAGIIQPFLKLNDLGFDKIENVFNVNFYGTLYITKLFLPHLLTRPEAHIVNISSMGGFLPVPGQTIYGASKAAVKLLTEGLASELSETNVHVTVVFPGALRTNIKANSGLGKEAGPSPEESASNAALAPSKAAEIIIHGMEKNERRIYVGKDSSFMDITYRLVPDSASKFIYKKLRHKIQN